MSEMRKYFARNWHNLFMLAFILKDQPIKWLFSSIQAHFARNICAFRSDLIMWKPIFTIK